MNFTKLPYWVLSGLMLTAGVSHAQDAASQDGGITSQNSAVAANDTAKPAAGASTGQADAGVRQRLLQDAANLIKSGKAHEAYALLLPYQSQRAGDPDYDYLLGLAALDSGKPNEAIFALERVLAVKPNHLQARAEIARAYFTVGENVTARQEFEAVQSQNPPKEVNATIQRFLDAISQGENAERTMKTGYLEAAIGYDTNVNSATGNSQVAIPAFGGAIATLNASGVEQKDSFVRVGAGGNVRQALSPEWTMFGGVNLNQRVNLTQTMFNTRGVDSNIGFNRTKGEESYSAAVQLQGFDIDDRRYRNGVGMTVQWQHGLSNSSQASSYLQYTDLRYPGQSIRDADRYILGVAYAGVLSGDYTPAVYLGGYGGEEKVRQAGVQYLGHRPYGVKAGGELRMNSQTKLFGSASVEVRQYGGQDPFFLVTRKDTQIDLQMGVNYIVDKLWTVSPQLGYTKNISNIAISDYKRTLFSVNVRRDFN